MTLPTFVLIHGAHHNAACWGLLVQALARRGAPAIAVDLPCEDPSAGARAYADTVLSRTALLDDVVVVGHSMGGLTAPIVASERQARELILLCAALPVVGTSLDARAAAEPDMQAPFVREHRHEVSIDPDGTFPPPDPAFAKAVFYQDCSSRHQEWAVTQLRRQAPLLGAEIWPLKAWGSCSVRGIYSRGDRVLSLEWHRRAFQDRFGAAPEIIDGGHSPFLSRPDELAALLLRPYSSAEGAEEAA